MTEPAWPPDFTAWKPEDWSAFGTCLTALIAIAAALVAWRQVREAAQLRREQAEPYVAVWMEEGKAGGRFIDLVVRNFGATAAYDTQLSATPRLVRSTKNEQSEGTVYIPQVIRTLVPGQEWRTFWDFAPDYLEAGLPELYEIAVKFCSQPGQKKIWHEYRFQLDWTASKNAPNIVVYGSHHTAKAMREVAKQVKKWSEFSKGLSVVVRDGDARDRQRRAELEEYRKTQDAGKMGSGQSERVEVNGTNPPEA